MKQNKAEVKSWAEWFERRARHCDNPLMKIAYYMNGRLLPDKLMRATMRDAWEKLGAGRECSVLDVGGGVGLFARTFQSKLKRIITTDISVTMTEDSCRLNPGGSFLACEAAALPFATSSFDRLLCYSVFHYFKDRRDARKALIEFVRVIKPGGLALLGDIPSGVREAQKKGKDKRETKPKKAMDYPASLKHNLKYTFFEPEFFIKFCRDHGLKCSVLEQNIKEKPTSSCRFDIRIEVAK